MDVPFAFAINTFALNALRVEHLAEVVEVSQVRLGGTHRFEVFEHVSQLVANSLKTVTLFKPAGIIARGCASEDI